MHTKRDIYIFSYKRPRLVVWKAWKATEEVPPISAENPGSTTENMLLLLFTTQQLSKKMAKPQKRVLLNTGKDAFPFNTWNSCSSLLRKSICSNKTFWSSSKKKKRKVVLLICGNNSWENSRWAIHYDKTKYFSSKKKKKKSVAQTYDRFCAESHEYKSM